jgi:hypothetical protein
MRLLAYCSAVGYAVSCIGRACGQRESTLLLKLLRKPTSGVSLREIRRRPIREWYPSFNRDERGWVLLRVRLADYAWLSVAQAQGDNRRGQIS